MSQIENALPFQFPFTTNTNAFEQFDFSLKKTDSCDYLHLGHGINAPLAPLTQNKSILMNNNNNINNSKAQNAQNDMLQFPWLNHNEQENNFGNIFQDANFSLNYVNSFPAANDNRKNFQNANDDYDFMNLNSDENDNHYDNISNPFNNDNDFFQRNNMDSEYEQFKTNQSFFNQAINEQKNQQANIFDQQNQFQGQKTQQGSSNIESQNSFGEANLLKIDDFKEMPFEMIIEPYSEEEQRQIREENEKRERDGQPKISERDLHGRKYEKIIQKRRDYDKNICRYIARQMMRCFISEEYKEIILKRFCNQSEELYEKILPFIRSSIPKISGHRAFKDLLAILKEEENDVKEWKMIFRKFVKWFLRERSLRYIMLGNSEDKTQYIRFKNQVMLHFINKPEQWNANLKINPYPFKVRNMSYNQYANPVYQDTTTSSQEQF